MRMMRMSVAFAAALLVVATLPAISQSSPKQREQTHFSAEDENVNHPVEIPAEVLALLAKDERVQNVLKDENIAPASLPASWFSAAQVHLGSKNEQDLVVASKGPIVGGNISPFWVFIHDGSGYKLALSISVHDLVVKRTRSRGYRNLEIDGMTASTITSANFRFDGNEYKESSERTTDIK
jgi:hypothetical protein